MIVREAVPEDIPALVELGRRMREESLVPYPAIDEEVLRERLFVLPGYVVHVCEQDGFVIGMLASQCSTYIFSRGTYAYHDIFYVMPERRGSWAAVLLIKAFLKWADSLGIRRKVIAQHTQVNAERTLKFYERMGFKPMGGIYFKDD